jgi:hypothetical protein
MKARSFTAITFAFFVLMWVDTAIAQPNPIKIRFEIDGKHVRQPFRINVFRNGLVFRPKIAHGTFVFPPELLADEKVNLRFISGKYDLYFENIPLRTFNDITIGVDNRPFAEGNLPSKSLPNRELVLVYYISFGTAQLIYHVYK